MIKKYETTRISSRIIAGQTIKKNYITNLIGKKMTKNMETITLQANNKQTKELWNVLRFYILIFDFYFLY